MLGHGAHVEPHFSLILASQVVWRVTETGNPPFKCNQTVLQNAQPHNTDERQRGEK